MNIKALTIAIAIATATAATATATESWTKNGKTIEADFVSLVDGMLTIRKVARDYTFEVASLSPGSQKLAKSLADKELKKGLPLGKWSDTKQYYYELQEGGTGVMSFGDTGWKGKLTWEMEGKAIKIVVGDEGMAEYAVMIGTFKGDHLKVTKLTGMRGKEERILTAYVPLDPGSAEELAKKFLAMAKAANKN